MGGGKKCRYEASEGVYPSGDLPKKTHLKIEKTNPDKAKPSVGWGRKVGGQECDL